MKRKATFTVCLVAALLGLCWFLSSPVSEAPTLPPELAFLSHWAAFSSNETMIKSNISELATSEGYHEISRTKIKYPALRFDFSAEASFEAKRILPALKANGWLIEGPTDWIQATKRVGTNSFLRLDVLRDGANLTIGFYDERHRESTWWDWVTDRIQRL